MTANQVSPTQAMISHHDELVAKYESGPEPELADQIAFLEMLLLAKGKL
ncbi:MAG: hypothetical protein JWQ87_5427 [Candidatus Sulfotelmatobacter sp.]|nr:hypothetical protein [Candidatus Sulfotelmatobacter sp.]